MGGNVDEITAVALFWTREVPTEPGMYWMRRRPGDRGRITQVLRERGNRLYAMPSGSPSRYLDEPHFAAALWAGPIPEPSEPIGGAPC